MDKILNRDSSGGNVDLHIGISESWGQFIVYQGGALTKSGHLKPEAGFQEINAGELLAAVKNHLLHYKTKTIEFETSGQEQWQLQLVPLNFAAELTFQQHVKEQ